MSARVRSWRARNCVGGGAQIACGEIGDAARKDGAEALRVHAPAHDVDGVGPGMLARMLDVAVTRPIGGQNAGRGAIAEQRGRHDVGLGHFIGPEGQRAQFDDHQQDLGARLGTRQPRGKRQARNPARTAKAEDRNAPHIVAKAHPVHDAGLDRGRRDAGRGDGDDGVDLARLDSGLVPSADEAASRNKCGGAVDEGLGAFGPALLGPEPADRA